MSHIRNPSSPSFHPNVSHPEFLSAVIPPGCLTSGIPPANVLPYPDVSHPEFFSAAHSTRRSHIRNSAPPPFHPDVSHPEFFFAAIPFGYLTSRILPGRLFTFSGYLTSGILSADVQPSPNISHPEFCPTDVPPFSSSLEHLLEVPKIPFSINLAAIFFSASNFRIFHDFKMI
ncbi:hypothetical protein VitviT2T_024344 [Vitis vinifera]|uniref:Uncharacterized protein n=1 Tax=Vitis vinifera TaxID=29760 RepID=A0ABY9DGB2_VITVI|nr:hypothetical protein VitviT2T_024344 [Vitis vinifera]